MAVPFALAAKGVPWRSSQQSAEQLALPPSWPAKLAGSGLHNAAEQIARAGGPKYVFPIRLDSQLNLNVCAKRPMNGSRHALFGSLTGKARSALLRPLVWGRTMAANRPS